MVVVEVLGEGSLLVMHAGEDGLDLRFHLCARRRRRDRDSAGAKAPSQRRVEVWWRRVTGLVKEVDFP
jgi:hypothetical protein